MDRNVVTWVDGPDEIFRDWWIRKSKIGEIIIFFFYR